MDHEQQQEDDDQKKLLQHTVRLWVTLSEFGPIPKCAFFCVGIASIVTLVVIFATIIIAGTDKEMVLCSIAFGFGLIHVVSSFYLMCKADTPMTAIGDDLEAIDELLRAQGIDPEAVDEEGMPIVDTENAPSHSAIQTWMDKRNKLGAVALQHERKQEAARMKQDIQDVVMQVNQVRYDNNQSSRPGPAASPGAQGSRPAASKKKAGATPRDPTAVNVSPLSPQNRNSSRKKVELMSLDEMTPQQREITRADVRRQEDQIRQEKLAVLRGID